ncbi:MAG: tRNA (adenosine(37)-N6)-dimethylallyltransferase MiaA, partial [Bacteroidaceae bacterium]|nr:tRNA (adenosine(37)-N6)-dimethylallyltransferase MiaA [Bacteroidaceae bacterium]
MQKTLLVLLGPTGVGKTELSIQLAEQFKCPIINADSRQIYKDIEIGTAAPAAEELARVKHYFVHTLGLDEYYSAAEFEKDVLVLLDELFKAHDVVVLSGGSMMYIDAVTKGIDDIPTVDDETRVMLRKRFEKEGLEPLLAELKLLDPQYYGIVDHRNHKRVVHALEICYMTGKTYTSFRTNTLKERPFNVVKFGLMRDREQLFARINARVDQMIQKGLMEEVKRVYPLRHLNSLNTVGYKELFKVLDGEWELPMAVERIKKNTRVYAKKQMTWYKHDADIHWLKADQMNTLEMLKTIENEVFV